MSQSEDKKKIKKTSDLPEEQVKKYLEDNKDFFDRHSDLIDIFEFSHVRGKTASIFEKQVSVLREKNVELRHRISTLTNNAKKNDAIFKNSRDLILSLLDAENLDELNANFSYAMKNTFSVEYSCIIFFGDAEKTKPIRVEKRDVASDKIGPIIKGQKPVCGALRKTELDFLFPESKGIGSAAVIPIINTEVIGVIAMGSSNATYYNSDMGTLFLTYIAEILARSISNLNY
ncbi:MAG: DUF484 family protein [Halieaceae bacterium]|nr:DUF484 family protein [Halieaceae bacterium]